MRLHQLTIKKWKKGEHNHAIMNGSWMVVQKPSWWRVGGFERL